MSIRILVVGLVLAVAPSLAAQSEGAIPDVGLTWTGSIGGTAGAPCNGFSTTPDTVTLSSGENVTIEIHGDLGSFYVLAVSTGASSFTPFAGVGNALLLDLPFGILSFGFNDFVDPAGCAGGRAILTGTSNLPPGDTFAIQAFGFASGSPWFSNAIEVTTI